MVKSFLPHSLPNSFACGFVHLGCILYLLLLLFLPTFLPRLSALVRTASQRHATTDPRSPVSCVAPCAYTLESSPKGCFSSPFATYASILCWILPYQRSATSLRCFRWWLYPLPRSGLIAYTCCDDFVGTTNPRVIILRSPFRPFPRLAGSPPFGPLSTVLGLPLSSYTLMAYDLLVPWLALPSVPYIPSCSFGTARHGRFRGDPLSRHLMPFAPPLGVLRN